MTSNGMYTKCVCHTLRGEPDEDSKLTLLSTIPNQRIYRCCNCHSFLSYTEDEGKWEVLLQGNIEEEIKDLYQADASAHGAA